MSAPISSSYKVLTVKRRTKIRDEFTNKRQAMRECRMFARERGPGTRGSVTTKDGALLLQGHVDAKGRFVVDEL